MWAVHTPVWWYAGRLAASPPVPVTGDLWDRSVYSAAVILAPAWPTGEAARPMQLDALTALTLLLAASREPEYLPAEAIGELVDQEHADLAAHLRSRLTANEDTLVLADLVNRLLTPVDVAPDLPPDRPFQAEERPGVPLAHAQQVIKHALTRH
jgi:hypothetical protein